MSKWSFEATKQLAHESYMEYTYIYIYIFIYQYIYRIYISYNHIYIYTVFIHDFMLDFIHEFIWYLCMIDEIPWNSQWIPWWSWAPRWTHSASASCDDMRWPLEVTWGYSNSWMVYDGKSPWKNSLSLGFFSMTAHDFSEPSKYHSMNLQIRTFSTHHHIIHIPSGKLT